MTSGFISGTMFFWKEPLGSSSGGMEGGGCCWMRREKSFLLSNSALILTSGASKRFSSKLFGFTYYVDAVSKTVSHC